VFLYRELSSLLTLDSLCVNWRTLSRILFENSRSFYSLVSNLLVSGEVLQRWGQQLYVSTSGLSWRWVEVPCGEYYRFTTQFTVTPWDCKPARVSEWLEWRGLSTVMNVSYCQWCHVINSFQFTSHNRHVTRHTQLIVTECAALHPTYLTRVMKNARRDVDLYTSRRTILYACVIVCSLHSADNDDVLFLAKLHIRH